MKKKNVFYLAAKKIEEKGRIIYEYLLDTHQKPRLYLSLDSLKRNAVGYDEILVYSIDKEIKIKQ